jgi:REP element-mobilizing transposase RayT
MARAARVKKTSGGAAYYHLMSRTNDRRFLFVKGRVKTQLVDALKRAAAFSGVEIDAYVAMDNHFHVVCKIVRRDEPVPEDEILRRVAALKGDRAAEELSSHWEELRQIGLESVVAEAQDRLRARMNDISEFMKTFKETFNVWYKRERRYTGTIWSGRFTSTLVEGGRYRAVCMRYVYLNPVRAGIVTRAADYAWSWIAAIDAPFAGSVPDRRLERRVAQIGSGTIFGSAAFVVDMVVALRDRFRAQRVPARAVEDIGFATHGWRIAEKEVVA